MKTFLSLLSLLSVAGLLLTSGCASENNQGGAYDSLESSHGQYTTPPISPGDTDSGNFWGRDYRY